MLPEVPMADPAVIPAAETVQPLIIPIPADVPLSEVLVTTWSDFVLVCSFVYAFGLCMGFIIWEVRNRRRIRKSMNTVEA